MGTTASPVVGAISETHGLAAAAIPAPTGACADATNKCVLTYNNSTYAWEVIARADNGQ